MSPLLPNQNDVTLAVELHFAVDDHRVAPRVVVLDLLPVGKNTAHGNGVAFAGRQIQGDHHLVGPAIFVVATFEYVRAILQFLVDACANGYVGLAEEAELAPMPTHIGNIVTAA